MTFLSKPPTAITTRTGDEIGLLTNRVGLLKKTWEVQVEIRSHLPQTPAPITAGQEQEGGHMCSCKSLRGADARPIHQSTTSADLHSASCEALGETPWAVGCRPRTRPLQRQNGHPHPRTSPNQERVIWSLESLVRNQKHGTRSSIGEQQEAMDGREVTMWFRLSDSSCWLTRILPGRLSAESSQAASHCAISSLPGLLGSRKGNHLSGLTKQQAAVTTNSSLAHWQMDFYRQLSTPAASWRIDRLSPLAA